jgi:hypothetical protein
MACPALVKVVERRVNGVKLVITEFHLTSWANNWMLKVELAASKLLRFSNKSVLRKDFTDPFTVFNGRGMCAGTAIHGGCFIVVANIRLVAELAFVPAWTLVDTRRRFCGVDDHSGTLKIPCVGIRVKRNDLGVEVVVILVDSHIEGMGQGILSHIDLNLHKVFKLGRAHTFTDELYERLITVRLKLCNHWNSWHFWDAQNNAIHASTEMTLVARDTKLLTILVKLPNFHIGGLE